MGDDFRTDKQGRRYADVLKIPGFDHVLDFFDDWGRQHRMIDSELHHDRPALSGVVRELERDETMKKLYEGLSKKEAVRFRQAVGVIVRIVMSKHAWRPTRTRGSLKGLSEWFTRTERYISPKW